MKVLIDIVLLLIIALCIWGGYKKGLIMGVGGVVAILISVYVGTLLAGTYSGEVIPAFRPFISGYVEGQVQEKVIAEMGLEESDYSLNDILAGNEDLQQEYAQNVFEMIGIYSRTSERYAEDTMEYLHTHEGTDVEGAVVEILCQKVTYALAFLLVFVLVLIILTVIGNIPNLTYKIPNMDALNNVGGLVLGIVRGIMLCSVLVWVLKFAGILLGDALEHTLLARLLLRLNFLTPWLGV